MGENTEDHRRFQQDEANAIERDKATTTSTTRGLFGGRFRRDSSRRFNVIRDDEDGVERCPQCTWEIHDGWCEGCGLLVEEDWSDDGSGYSDGVSDLDHDTLDQDLYSLPDDYIDELTARVIPGEEGSLSPHGRHHAESFRVPGRARAIGRQRDMEEDLGRDRRMPVAARTSRSPERHVAHHPAYSDEGMEDGAMDPDTDHYDSEADYPGSLDDFVDDDGDGGPTSMTVSTLSISDTDSVSEAESGQDMNGYNARFSPLHGDVENDGQESYISEVHDSDEDMDQNPVRNRRDTRHHRRVISDDESDSDESQRTRQYRNSMMRFRLGDYQDLISHGGSSQQAPIEIPSDSDSVRVPAQRVRRRRAVIEDESSNDDTPTQSRYSQSPDTLHQPTNTGSQAEAYSELQSQPSAPASPIMIGSSPVRTMSVVNWTDANSDRGRSPPLESPHHSLQARDTSNGRSHPAGHIPSRRSVSSLDEASPPPEPRHVAEFRRLPHFSRRLAPVAARHSPSDRSTSQRSRTPLSPPSRSLRANVSPRSLQGPLPREERATYKAQRRLAKQERRRRNRVDANVASGESYPLRSEASARTNEAFGRRWN